MSFLVVATLGLVDYQCYCIEFGDAQVLLKGYVHTGIHSDLPVDSIHGIPNGFMFGLNSVCMTYTYHKALHMYQLMLSVIERA